MQLGKALPGTTAFNDDSQVDKERQKYMECFENTPASLESRSQRYTWVVNTFYNLVTDFYEYGWGQSFHFAPRAKDETFRESLKRHEHYIALKLNLEPGMKVADLGAGVGGPLREIATFSGASIIGVNNNDYQINKGNINILQAGLAGTCQMLKADFMHLPFEDNSLDAAYQIEATCHSPDRVACYKEIYRCIKPGGLFSGYEWVMTDLYDKNNPAHNEIRTEIEVGNGLPPIITTEDCKKALIQAGFEILETNDLGIISETSPISWYDELDGKMTLSGFRHTHVGRYVTHTMVSAAERLKMVPKGTTDVSSLLIMTAKALVAGGKTGVFTPCYFYVARKKAEPSSTPPKVTETYKKEEKQAHKEAAEEDENNGESAGNETSADAKAAGRGSRRKHN